MIYKERPGPACLVFPLLEEIGGSDHGIYTRSGGVSSGGFRSLNTSFGVGDDPRCVAENRQRIARAVRGTHLVFVRQVHGDDVVVYRDTGAGFDPPEIPDTGDAIVTDIPGIFLVIQVADCQPVLIFDPKRMVVGNVHSGWRGSIHNIVGKTVEVMVRDFGCRPEDLRVGIGPSLGPCCAEFINFRREIPERFWAYKDKHDRFDFWAITIDQLISAGVRPDRIESSRQCTRCDTKTFFSYRSETETGRFAAVVGLVGTNK